MKRLFILIIAPTLLLVAFLATAPQARAAFFTFSTETTTIDNGNRFEVKVSIDTQSQNTNGVDIVLTYPQDSFRVEGATFSSLYPNTFQQLDATSGTVSLSASATNAFDGFNGNSLLAILTVTALNAGTPSFTFDCQRSSIWLKGGNGEDILDCSRLREITFTIREVAAPTEAPTYIPFRGTCTATQPTAPSGILATSGPGVGEVTLSWNPSTSSGSPVTHYGVNYGVSPGRYSRGAPSVGKVNRFTIGKLEPGRIHYFTVYAVNDCATSPLSLEVWAFAAETATGLPSPKLGAPEIIFVDLQSSRSATPSSEPTEAPITFTSTPSAESGQNNFFKYFFIAGAILFLIILYLLGRKKSSRGAGPGSARPPSYPSYTPPSEPHHGSPVPFPPSPALRDEVRYHSEGGPHIEETPEIPIKDFLHPQG